MSAPNLPRDSASPISITDQQSTTRTFETLLAELRAARARGDPLPETTEEEESWLRDYRSDLPTHVDWLRDHSSDLRSHANDFRLVTQVLARHSGSRRPVLPHRSTLRTFETLLAELRAAGARRDPLPETTEEEERWLRDYRSDLRSHDNDRSLVTEVLARRSRLRRLVLPPRSTLRTFETILAEVRAAGARGDPSPELSRMQEGWLLDCIVDLPSDANDRILVMELVASRERRDAPPPPNYANAVPAERRPIEGEKCAICQDSFEDHKEEELQTCKVGRCGITFHTECITPWFQSCQQRMVFPTCPNCRRKWWF
jgi:hypothetical protein